MKRFTHTTIWEKEIEALMEARGVNRRVIIEEMFAEKFDSSSSAPEVFTAPWEKCCLECGFGSCPDMGCSSGYLVKEEAKSAGGCDSCFECPDHTPAEPKKERKDR